MKEKLLPIKFFEKRKEYDDRSTEAGGGKKPPSWILKGSELIERANSLCKDVEKIKKEFIVQKERRLPLVIISSLEKKALAKSYRKNVNELLNCDDKDNVIGFFEADKILSTINNQQTLNKMPILLQAMEKNSTMISSLLNIDLFKPVIIPSKEQQIYKIKLINYNNYDLNVMNRILFEKKCNQNNIEINKKTKYTSNLIVYKVTLDNIERVKLFENFEGIYSVEPMEYIELTLDSLDLQNSFLLNKKKNGVEYPKIGILDTGIASNELMNNWILAQKHLNYPEEYQDNSHGTFVAGIAQYGNVLNNCDCYSLDGVEILDAVVYPNVNKQKIYVDDLIENIREAVERNKDIKIWNLSLGTNTEASLEKFSDFGIALDNIQDENDILIIKSAGNCMNFTKNLPKSRIAQSADSIRALVVGSISKIKEKFDYAEENYPSPFTRIGPGPSNIVKPDLVYYGGNVGIDNKEIIKNGMLSIGKNGTFARDCGTSFSTPFITRMAAELNFLLKEEFDPLLIKAMLIHSAKYPKGIKMTLNEKITQMGFGIPEKANNILYNSSDEITLILRDTLAKGTFIEMFDFPYPKSLVDEYGFFRGQITLTLVTKSLVDERQSGEYCQSNINVLLGTYESEVERDISKKTIKNPYGREEGKNILIDELYSSKVKKEHNIGAFEREYTLIKYGKKYHPIKKYAVDLSDITPSNKEKYLKKDKKWFLKIEGLYRDFIEKDYKKNNQELTQEYCLILTIKDPQGKVNVYDEVTQLLTINNFVHYDINVRPTVNVTVE